MPEQRLAKTRRAYDPAFLLDSQKAYAAAMESGDHAHALDVFREVVNRCAQAMRYLDEMRVQLPDVRDPRWSTTPIVPSEAFHE